MRTTLRIDDDLLQRLKARAAAEKISLTELVNRVIRQGIEGFPIKRVRHRERVFSMGQPRLNLDKALALAAAEEDSEVVRKLAARK